MATQKYCVKMRFKVDNGNAPAGSHAYLSFRGRHEWSKRTAAKHLKDVSTDSRWTTFYDKFELEEA